ncbi:MAG TPA: hypothetical protein VN461_17665 [Vicinamibacteria bacterium]|nr:hypothetical protein [Vicinamibacteria bacterium]
MTPLAGLGGQKSNRSYGAAVLLAPAFAAAVRGSGMLDKPPRFRFVWGCTWAAEDGRAIWLTALQRARLRDVVRELGLDPDEVVFVAEDAWPEAAWRGAA